MFNFGKNLLTAFVIALYSSIIFSQNEPVINNSWFSFISLKNFDEQFPPDIRIPTKEQRSHNANDIQDKSFERQKANLSKKSEQKNQSQDGDSYLNYFKSMWTQQYQSASNAAERTKNKALKFFEDNYTVKAFFDQIDKRYLNNVMPYIKPTAMGIGGFTLLLIVYKIGYNKSKREHLEAVNNASPNPYIRKIEISQNRY